MHRIDLTGRLLTDGPAVSSINYSYVFGTHRGSERHDPQVRRQRGAEPVDLKTVSELLRRGFTGDRQGG
jgi:hypothetical protein